MRERERYLSDPSKSYGPFLQDLHDSAEVWYNQVAYDPGGYYIPGGSYERMTDDDGPGRNTKICDHFKSEFKELNPQAHQTCDWGYNPGFYHYPNYIIMTGPGAFWNSWGAYRDNSLTYINEIEMGEPYFSESRDDSVRQAAARFYQANEVESALNAIESPELVRTLHLLKKLKPSKKLGTPVTRRIRRLVDLVSGGYLAYQFGIAPLLSDLKSLHGSMQNMQKILDKISRDFGKPTNVYHRTYGILPDFEESEYCNDPVRYIPVWDKRPIRIVRIRGIRSSPHLGKTLSSLNLLLGKFGANGPFDLAWELIPFSFVVDWFVDTSRILAEVDNVLTGRFFQIQDISVSESYKVVVKDKFVPPSPYYVHQHEGTVTSERTVSRYNRFPWSHYNNIGWSGRFGKKQGLLSLALVSNILANLRLR